LFVKKQKGEEIIQRHSGLTEPRK